MKSHASCGHTVFRASIPVRSRSLAYLSEKDIHEGNCPPNMKRHQNVTMQFPLKVLMAVICGLTVGGVGTSLGQEAGSNPASMPTVKAQSARAHALTKSDRTSVIAVALHSKRARDAGHDCSHLVHSIYERAGFSYPYADSDDLYDGAKGFRRVAHPEPADLVVWHGHVGIVIRPSGHQFFSFLSKGPGIDDYRSRYWKSRGQPRFYRYVKNDS